MIPPRFQSIFHKPETTIKLSTSTASHCGSIAAHLSLSPRSKRKLASSESWRSGRIPFAECNGKKKKREKQDSRNGTSATPPLSGSILEEGRKRKTGINFYSCSVSVHPRIEDKGVALFSGCLSFRIEEELMKLEGGREYSCWRVQPWPEIE